MDVAKWAACLKAGFGSFGIGALLLFCLMVLIDRGYFGLLQIIGVDDRTVTGIKQHPVASDLGLTPPIRMTV
ncbi:hypothetical protein [Bradyrhizobium sp. USDA 329]|uniref:hypothetical protein n=1 Tax=unclassified Bradyrhizobium TaxID=2631580 RepID=UPI00351612E2